MCLCYVKPGDGEEEAPTVYIYSDELLLSKGRQKKKKKGETPRRAGELNALEAKKRSHHRVANTATTP